MSRFRSFVLVLLFSPCVGALAQDLPAAGSRVRITLGYHPHGEQYRTFEGVIARVGAESLTVSLSDPRPFDSPTSTIPFGNIDLMEVPGGQVRSTKQGLGWGVLAGFFAGSLMGMASHPVEDPGTGSTPTKSALKFGAVGGVIGGVAGAAIGSSRSHDVWIAVDMGDRQPSVGLRRWFGVAVSLAF